VGGRNERAGIARTEATADRLLVRRFNAGDQSAFTEIVQRHRDRIQNLALRFLRDHGDAEEIAQDTFVRAFRGLAKFRGESSLATWLHHIATNLARNRYWYFFRRRRHQNLSLDCPLSAEATGTFADLIPSGAADPRRTASKEEFVALVASCMKQLDAANRDILVRRSQLRCSYANIAHALGINEGTVKSRISRARGQLLSLMVEACPEFPPEAAAREWFEPARSAHPIGAGTAA
jgi:RNA polymerase sigma-70 factor (ECF subfamily)